MASVQEDRRGMLPAEALPSSRSPGVFVVALLAVLAVIALMWKASRQHAAAPPAPSPIAMAEPPPTTTAGQAAAAEAPAAAPAAADRTAAAPADEAATTVQQSAIARVIRDGRLGLTACYQRALVRDNTLVSGHLMVRLAVAPSGRVDRVRISGPAAYHVLEPCLRAAVSRWDFPAADAPYETSFPLVFRGGE